MRYLSSGLLFIYTTLGSMNGVSFIGLTSFAIFSPVSATAETLKPISIPLQHVSAADDADDIDALGIMIGVNGSQPRLYQFDTGSDEFFGQIEDDVVGVSPLPGRKPEFYPYGDGSYGYWMQMIQFSNMEYYDPKQPDKPITTISGQHAMGQVLDWVYSKSHSTFKDHRMSAKPIGHADGTALYAELEVRERIKNGQPSDHPPFFGTFGAGDFIDENGPRASIGSQTDTGYVISANANIYEGKTPGCSPCLLLNLTPSIRAQFTGMMPWGKMDYEGSQRSFFGSGANASTEAEGNYSYTISFTVGKKKRAVQLKSPIMFDTGTADFIYIDDATLIKKLRASGLKLPEYDDATVDIKFNGFIDKINDIEYTDVDIGRLADEVGGGGITLGLPFFHQNSVMYDLEARLTAFSPFFVSAENFSTSIKTNNRQYLGKIHSDMGSSGWLGLAGVISGNGEFLIGKDSVVRLTNENTYTGATIISEDALLYLAGPGSIEFSEQVVIDGLLSLDQKGSAFKSWQVPVGMNQVILKDITGSGDIFLGSNQLVLKAANGMFAGTISDSADGNDHSGGSVLLAGGKLTLTGDSEYSGLTEVASGAELHIQGDLISDISVHGKLIVDGNVYGTVRVNRGGQVTGTGTVASLKILPGGIASKMKTSNID